MRTPRFPQLRDHDWLKRRYVTERLTTTAIAGELGCSAKLVSEHLALAGIAARPFVGQNTSGSNWALRRSLANHAPVPGDAKAPVLTPRPPVADQSLLVRFDAGWVSGPERMLMVVQPHHTFADLASVGLEALIVQTDPNHLVEVWVHPQGRPTRSYFGWPRYTPHAWNDPGMTVFVPRIESVCVDGYPDLLGTGGRSLLEATTTTVCSVLGTGWFCWVRYDLGSENWFGVRAVTSVPPRPDTLQPEVLVRPLATFDLD